MIRWEPVPDIRAGARRIPHDPRRESEAANMPLRARHG